MRIQLRAAPHSHPISPRGSTPVLLGHLQDQPAALGKDKFKQILLSKKKIEFTVLTMIVTCNYTLQVDVLQVGSMDDQLYQCHQQDCFLKWLTLFAYQGSIKRNFARHRQV